MISNNIRFVPDWYEERIEEPLQGIVKYLRNHGINTEQSCGHGMTIQCQCTMKEYPEDLHFHIWNYLQENELPITFQIDFHHAVEKGQWFFPSYQVQFNIADKNLWHNKLNVPETRTR